jgi:hypothetical protein
MTSSLRRTLTTTATAVVGAMLVGSVGSAVLAVGVLAAPATSSATTTATPPPWEPDPNSVGGLIFYNSSGTVITSGSINASPIAAYVEGTNTIRSGDTKATLFGFLPVKGEVPAEWSGEQLGESTAYPNAGAPAPLNASTLPVETGASGDETVAQLEADFPNNDHSSDGYAGMYQLRLFTSAPGESLTVTYDEADIHISGSTWTVVYSQAKTTTTLKASKKTITKGTKLTLTATETPVAKGSVAFFEGTKLLSTVKVSTTGVAHYSSTTIAVGTHSFTATFTPSNTDFDAPSTSAVVKVKVTS